MAPLGVLVDALAASEFVSFRMVDFCDLYFQTLRALRRGANRGGGWGEVERCLKKSESIRAFQKMDARCCAIHPGVVKAYACIDRKRIVLSLMLGFFVCMHKYQNQPVIQKTYLRIVRSGLSQQTMEQGFYREGSCVWFKPTETGLEKPTEEGV